jgi:hypothetical protein
VLAGKHFYIFQYKLEGGGIMMLDLDISGLEKLKPKHLENPFTAGNDLLKIKTANEWVEEARLQPDLKMLFGSLWYEGEVCLLFASSNLGKSVLAVQIAEAVARGQKSNLPLPVNCSPKRVLYIDSELSPKQFQMRCTEGDSSYAYSKNLYRAEIDRKKLLQGYTIEKLILGAIEKAIQEHQVEVIILDNICALRIDLEKSTEAVNLMSGLQQFQEEQGVSILILAHTPKRAPNQPITDNDLAGSKVLMNLADSAFTIGASQQDSGFRYIKQIKVRNSEKLYGTENVMLCELRKENEFLGFFFLDYDSEQQHLQQKSNGKSQEEELSLVRQLLKDGYSQRQISEHMEMSLGKVNKLCRIIKEGK